VEALCRSSRAENGREGFVKRLLVIVPDRISEVLEKGEYQPRYYNPGEVFEEVHILTTNDDRPDLGLLQRTVGRARLFVHNYPDNLNIVGSRWDWVRNRRLKQWAKGGVEIARSIGPDLIRCHGSDWNVYLASQIKAKLGVPYVVSLHINPDINPTRRYVKPDLSTDEMRHNAFYDYVELQGLRGAELVMPVYRPILSYLERLNVSRVEVCYNVLNGDNLVKKENYSLGSPSRIVYVGRLFAEKNPDNIMRALVHLPDAMFTIVGDGPIRPTLEGLAVELGISERVIFRPAIENDELCRLLVEQDIFVVHTEYWEISKSVLEALLTGLPVVINRRIGDPVPELQGDFVRMVDNTEEGYLFALKELLEDDSKRAALGCKAFDHARANWSPDVTEAKYASIYLNILQTK
jgi:glycosyltransferase involved in cell wall biosynthesis